MLGILGQDQKNSRRGLLEIKLSDFGHSKLINDGYSTALTRDAWTARMTHCWGRNGETSETKMKLLLDHARYFLIVPNTRLFMGQWLRVGSVKINAFDAFSFFQIWQVQEQWEHIHDEKIQSGNQYTVYPLEAISSLSVLVAITFGPATLFLLDGRPSHSCALHNIWSYVFVRPCSTVFSSTALLCLYPNYCILHVWSFASV